MKQTSYTNLGFDDITTPNATKTIPCMITNSHDNLNWHNLIWGVENSCEVYNVRAPDRARDGGLGLDQTAVMTFNNITNGIGGNQ